MTAIVGLVDGKTVWIGGDSACSAGCERLQRTEVDPKVFVRGEMVFGFAGPSRFGQVLEHLVEIPTQEEGPDFVYFITKFAPALKDAIEAYGGLKINDSSDGWDVLIGYRGGLYDVCHDFAVTRYDRYAAVGCGHAIAQGSLYTTDPLTFESIDPPYLNAETRLRLALSAAAEHDIHVAPPFVVLRTPER